MLKDLNSKNKHKKMLENRRMFYSYILIFICVVLIEN